MAEATASTTPSKRRIAPATIALVAAGLILVAALIYAATRSGEPSAAPEQAAPTQGPDPAQMVAEMRKRLSQDPDNHQGWYQLGRLYREMGQFSDAEAAFRRASELSPKDSVYVSYRAEALLLQGSDSSRATAKELFQQAAELDGSNAMARFYLATLRDHAGDPKGAIDDLVALLNSAPPNAPWFDHVRAQTEQLASLRKIDVAGRLPAPRPQSAATAAIPGPTREQMEAARNIPPSQQDEMVKGMVERLATRLQQNPRDERGWMMLMRSRMVQNDREGAAAALRSGLGAFADDPAVQQRLRAAAGELGIPQ